MRKPKHELTEDLVVLRILNELKMQGKTEKELEKALNMSNGTVTKWKYLDGKSYRNHIGRIADFLNVTVEYLQGKPEKQKQDIELTGVELRLIELFRKMSSGERKCMLQSAEYFANSSEFRKYKEMETGNESQSDENPLS
jgi:transcriptional regulator with XRE-family HTH domain